MMFLCVSTREVQKQKPVLHNCVCVCLCVCLCLCLCLCVIQFNVMDIELPHQNAIFQACSYGTPHGHISQSTMGVNVCYNKVSNYTLVNSSSILPYLVQLAPNLREAKRPNYTSDGYKQPYSMAVWPALDHLNFSQLMYQIGISK